MNGIGLYAKAVGGSLAAAGTAAITALMDGHITTAEWITIVLAFLGSLGAVWAVPNMPSGVAKYAKAITAAITSGLGALATAYVSGNTLREADLINIGIAILGSLGVVHITPNAAASDELAVTAKVLVDDTGIEYPDDEDPDAGQSEIDIPTEDGADTGPADTAADTVPSTQPT